MAKMTRGITGSSIIEYSFVAALVAGVGLAGSTFIGSEANTLFARLGNVMTTGQETSTDNLGDRTATQSLQRQRATSMPLWQEHLALTISETIQRHRS